VSQPDPVGTAWDSAGMDQIRTRLASVIEETLAELGVSSVSYGQTVADAVLANFRVAPAVPRSEMGFYVSVASSGRYENRVAHRPRHPSQQPIPHGSKMVVMACSVIREERYLEFYATLPVTVAGKPVRECSGCMQRLKNAGLL
jgi:hypothetical protein